mmetsp:Transcript_43807/g.93233  ORF Transcript_43807/g.93233 Transcript_43807/m.93233 type:complete len:314 (+) Transcript_43807:264-1205(+)
MACVVYSDCELHSASIRRAMRGKAEQGARRTASGDAPRIQLGRSLRIWERPTRRRRQPRFGRIGMYAGAKPVCRRDGERAVRGRLVGGGELVHPLGRVLHPLAVRRVDAGGGGGKGGGVDLDAGVDVHSPRWRWLAVLVLVDARGGHGGWHRQHRALPELLLPRRPLLLGLLVLDRRRHARSRSWVTLGSPRGLDLDVLALVGLDIDAADHRLLGPAEPLERLQVLAPREVGVVDRLLGEALAARNAVRAHRDNELAPLSLVALHLGGVLGRVSMPVRRARLRPSLLPTRRLHLACLGPIRLVAVAAAAAYTQ